MHSKTAWLDSDRAFRRRCSNQPLSTFTAELGRCSRPTARRFRHPENRSESLQVAVAGVVVAHSQSVELFTGQVPRYLFEAFDKSFSLQQHGRLAKRDLNAVTTALARTTSKCQH